MISVSIILETRFKIQHTTIVRREKRNGGGIFYTRSSGSAETFTITSPNQDVIRSFSNVRTIKNRICGNVITCNITAKDIVLAMAIAEILITTEQVLCCIWNNGARVVMLFCDSVILNHMNNRKVCIATDELDIAPL